MPRSPGDSLHQRELGSLQWCPRYQSTIVIRAESCLAGRELFTALLLEEPLESVISTLSHSRPQSFLEPGNNTHGSLSRRLFPNSTDATRGNGRGLLKLLVLSHKPLSFYLSCFHQHLKMRVQELFPTYEPVTDGANLTASSSPWGQVHSSLVWCQSKRGFSKLSDRENLAPGENKAKSKEMIPGDLESWACRGMREWASPSGLPSFSLDLGSSGVIRWASLQTPHFCLELICCS